jgi:RNA ligase
MNELFHVNISKLLDYARNNPEYVSMYTQDNLIKLNYTTRAFYGGDWDDYLVKCRGIIIDTEANKIIAYPFNKFFNYFEYENMGTKIPIELRHWVTEKLDGILIIPFYHKGKLRFSTRGSFDNKYVDKAKEIATFDTLPLEKYTFMFELVSPRYVRDLLLVTPYEKEQLILVGIRDNSTNKLLIPPGVVEMGRKLDLMTYKIFELDYKKTKDQKEKITGNLDEGWVVFFENTFLVKIKRVEYLKVAQALKGLTPKRLLKELFNDTYNSYAFSLPEEIRNEVQKYYKIIRKNRDRFVAKIKQKYNKIPREIRDDRKEYYLYINKKFQKQISIFLSEYWKEEDENKLHKMFYSHILKGWISIPELSF